MFDTEAVNKYEKELNYYEMSIASKPRSLMCYYLDHENYKRKEQVNVGRNGRS